MMPTDTACPPTVLRTQPTLRDVLFGGAAILLLAAALAFGAALLVMKGVVGLAAALLAWACAAPRADDGMASGAP